MSSCIYDTVVLDENLASSDFFCRLVLVGAKNHVLNPSKNNEEDYTFWPALKYDSLKELFGDIDTTVNVANLSDVKALKAWITVHFSQLKQKAGVSADEACGVAYLLGQKVMARSLVVVSQQTSKVLDFYDNHEKISVGKKYYHNKDLKSAFEIAMSRLENTYYNPPFDCSTAVSLEEDIPPVVSPLKSPEVHCNPIDLEWSAHCKKLIDPRISWPKMLKHMKSEGWVWRPGSKLITFFWIHPAYKNLTKLELIKQCKEGKDYFTSTGSLQKYARAHLGWRGEMTSAQTLFDTEVIDGRKKRKSSDIAVSHKLPSFSPS